MKRAAAVRKPGRPSGGQMGAGRSGVKTQGEVIRDAMISAAECDTWLTLREIADMTRFGESSISAQLRHLKKPEYGGYRIEKRHRSGEGSALIRLQKKPQSSRTSREGPRRGVAQWERAYVLCPGRWEYKIEGNYIDDSLDAKTDP